MSTYKAEFYNGSSWVDVTLRLKDFAIDIELDISDMHIVTFQGKSFEYYTFNSSEVVNDYYFRISRTDGSTEYLFSGYVTNKYMSEKRAANNLRILEFDVEPDTEYLKTVIIDEFPVSTSWRNRLNDQVPSGYTIVGMDTNANTYLDETPSWLSSISYPDHYFSDLLFDTLLQINGTRVSFAYLFCHIVNKEIRFYSENQSSATIMASTLEDLKIGYKKEAHPWIKMSAIDDHLRGDGSTGLSGGGETTISKKIHKMICYDEASIYNKMVYDSVDYGFLTKISRNIKSGKFEYDITEILNEAP